MNTNPVFILTGEKASGKTTRLDEVCKILVSKKTNIHGFLSKGFWENNKRTHYNLHSIADSKEILLCSRSQKDKNWIPGGHFFFNPEAIAMGESLLNKGSKTGDLLVVDEVGKLETKKMLWYRILSKNLGPSGLPMIWTVRSSLLVSVKTFFDLDENYIFYIQNTNAENISGKILEHLKIKT
jgi:nucleoside-triphosphatase THEP1